jgi:hypothetical protein
MKMVKSLLLGSAAGLVAMAGAQAADLPVKAKPVQYVKICSLYGAGFYYIPGTDTCIKIGGWARFETAYGYNGSLTTEWWPTYQSNRQTADNPWRVKGNITIDARDQTEYGTLRSYVDVGISTSQNGNSNGAIGATAGTDDVANYANRWFIQWAGFTIGRSTSFYDFYSVGANQYGFVGAGSDTGDGGWLVFAYTAQLGNGLSASISAEEQRRTQIVNANLTTLTGGAATLGTGQLAYGAGQMGVNYEGHDYPDVVGNLRVEQAWGSAQVQAAWHNVAAQYYGVTEGTGHPADKSGFAVGVGAKINAPMLGKGDFFMAEFDYTQGASRYDNHTAAVWNYIMFKGNNVGIGINSDAVYGGTVAGANASGLELTTTWNVNAAYTHQWNAAWKTTLWGSYMQQDYNSNANAMLCTGGGVGAVAPAGCDMDWNIWGLGLRTEWAVSSNFQIGLEVLYAKLDSASTPGNLVAAAATGAKPASGALYTVGDQDNWAVRLRINRNFYP